MCSCHTKLNFYGRQLTLHLSLSFSNLYFYEPCDLYTTNVKLIVWLPKDCPQVKWQAIAIAVSIYLFLTTDVSMFIISAKKLQFDKDYEPNLQIW